MAKKRGWLRPGRQLREEEAPALTGTVKEKEAQDDPDALNKLFPSGLLKLLRLKSWRDITAGRQQFTNTVIMDVNAAGFSGFIHGRQARDVFDSINAMLDQALPLVCGRGGLVEGFEGGGFTALYQEDFGGAAGAAVAVVEELMRMKRTRPEYRDASVGLHFGPVMIGAVGNENRMTLLTISEAKEFTAFLRSLGPKYGAKILASGDFLDALRAGQERFNFRFLGAVAMRTTGREQAVYEIFDGDEVERRNCKRRTRIVFEKGAALYRIGRAREARLHFIEVLKTDRQDRAAREYVLKCDNCLSGDGEPYLEKY